MRTQDILDHLEKLIVLRTVANSGSIRAASEALNISQPSLSAKIKNLETVMGVKLLNRSGKGVVLTDAGQKALQFVKEVIKNAESLRVNIQRGDDDIEGHIVVGLYDSVACHIWPKFYKRFMKNYPYISMALKTGRSQELLKQLGEKDIDVAITVEPQLGRLYHSESLYRDHFSCYCSPTYVKEILGHQPKGQRLSLKKIAKKVSLILFSQALAEDGRQLETTLNIRYPDRFVFHDVENFEVALKFCLSGIGIAILPNKIAQADFEKKKLIKVSLDKEVNIDFSEHTINLSTLKSQTSIPIINTLIREFRQYTYENL